MGKKSNEQTERYREVVMEEDLKILEERVITLKRHIKNYEESNCKTNIYQQLIKECQAIENLIKGYKLEKLKNVLDEQSLKEALEDYIPKSKFREKMEELDNMIKEINKRKTSKVHSRRDYSF